MLRCLRGRQFANARAGPVTSRFGGRRRHPDHGPALPAGDESTDQQRYPEDGVRHLLDERERQRVDAVQRQRRRT
jgi:hypothetical protein